MEHIDELIENCDNLIVNYNTPKYTAKETLVLYSIGAGVGLACLGIIAVAIKTADVVETALYRRHVRKLNEQAIAKEEKLNK